MAEPLLEPLVVRNGQSQALEAASHAARKWVIYATFDAVGSPAAHVVEQLAAYRALGFSTLLVDASPALSAERERDWQAASTVWIQRHNVGYDFGSYKRGLEVLQHLSACPVEDLTVLLTNDSCYGPYTPLKPIFDHFDAFPLDASRVFGITESHELGHHIQSYFVYFRPDVMPLALQFFEQMPEIGGRADAIKYGELSLSKFLRKRHCELTVLWPSEKVIEHFLSFRRSKLVAILELAYRRYRRRPRYTKIGDRACVHGFLEMPPIYNSVIAFGSHMFFQGMTPFVKRELIRANPNEDPFVPELSRFEQLDTAGVARTLRSTPEYQRRYGKSAEVR